MREIELNLNDGSSFKVNLDKDIMGSSGKGLGVGGTATLYKTRINGQIAVLKP